MGDTSLGSAATLSSGLRCGGARGEACMPDAPMRRAAGPAIAHWLIRSCAFIIGGATPLPVLAAPAQPNASAPAMPAAESAASVTFHVRATREGLVGGTTSSGHVITPNDHFVALPCICALNKMV